MNSRHICQEKCRRLYTRTDPTISGQLKPHVYSIAPMVSGSILPVAEGRVSLCSRLPSIRLFANNLRSRSDGAASPRLCGQMAGCVHMLPEPSFLVIRLVPLTFPLDLSKESVTESFAQSAPPRPAI